MYVLARLHASVEHLHLSPRRGLCHALHMGNGGEFASVGLSQLGVTETDEPALLWDVVLCGVGPFGSRSKPVVGWSVCRLELDCLKSIFADRARN